MSRTEVRISSANLFYVYVMPVLPSSRDLSAGAKSGRNCLCNQRVSFVFEADLVVLNQAGNLRVHSVFLWERLYWSGYGETG